MTASHSTAASRLPRPPAPSHPVASWCTGIAAASLVMLVLLVAGPFLLMLVAPRSLPSLEHVQWARVWRYAGGGLGVALVGSPVLAAVDLATGAPVRSGATPGPRWRRYTRRACRGLAWAAFLLLVLLFAAPVLLPPAKPSVDGAYAGMAWMAIWMIGGVGLGAVIVACLSLAVVLAESPWVRLAGLAVVSAIAAAAGWFVFEIM